MRPETAPAASTVDQATVSEPAIAGPADAPARIGRFELRRLLGEGGFGRVFEAYDPTLKRTVALKVAKQADDLHRLERFLREAQAAGALTHPHIVPVFDSGTDGPHRYIASAFVLGQPLSRAVRPGFAVAGAARIVRKLAEALGYAHRMGVIHRDVKPANVMLRDDGEPLLMDFGLARRGEDQAGLTHAGQFVGTPAYAAPEQWKGQATAASDQYALGCVLHGLLVGEPAFAGGDMVECMGKHVNEPPPPLPGIPRDLAAVVFRCLEKEAGRRYADCQALADDLGRWMKREPTRARPVGVVGKTWRWARREPIKAVLVGTAVVFGVAACFLAAWALVEKGHADANAASEKAARQKADRQTRRMEDARHALQLDLALQAWSRNDVATAEQLLADVVPRLRDAWETRHVR
ncbi:MAG: serine/threonine protein kinase, partial [Gemmataceae bacterium]|nr:serine/threonine protein kinase [Gemmataceae bacterium]